MPGSFETSELARLLGTSPLRVIKLTGRFKIRASVKGGGKQGKRRRFSVRDICQIGLTLWLFRAGLRALVIRNVLNRKQTKVFVGRLSSLSGIQTEAKQTRFLIVYEPQKPKVVLTGDLGRVRKLLNEATCVVVPLGPLLERLAKCLENFAI